MSISDWDYVDIHFQKVRKRTKDKEEIKHL